MYDSKEIAERALSRAETLKTANRRRRVYMNAVFTLAVVFAAVFYLARFFSVAPVSQTGNNEPGVMIDDGMVPLAPGAFLSTDGDSSAPYIYTAPVYGHITIPAGSPQMDVIFQNPPDNKYLLTYELVLEDTGESLYISDILEPGGGVDAPVPAVIPAAGEHKALLRIRAYDPGDHSLAGETTENLLLIVNQ